VVSKYVTVSCVGGEVSSSRHMIYEQTFGIHVIQDDQKVSVHVMITIQKVTSSVQSVPRQSPDIY
jgi:alpha-acetolactate decarboxylase